MWSQMQNDFNSGCKDLDTEEVWEKKKLVKGKNFMKK